MRGSRAEPSGKGGQETANNPEPAANQHSKKRGYAHSLKYCGRGGAAAAVYGGLRQAVENLGTRRVNIQQLLLATLLLVTFALHVLPSPRGVSQHSLGTSSEFSKHI